MTNILRNCDIKECKGVLDCLIEEYNDRFKDFEQHDTTLQLVFQPHLLDVLKAPDYLQMELIELSEDQIFKSLFNDKKNPIEIWKNAVDYPKLREHARRILSCFGTTYCCESTFSHMTQIKYCLRSQLTNAHLEDQLRLKTTRLEPNIKLLSSNKQSQKSH
ncbi:general transcription factor II-I repeat domain-containing protein 2-like [Condylostylus longicornis]|uniref:general transcription factor II-I repeat domain-containing protein 2-like n=1 Tax=Condylostylus longicornis TaxID=2530218 RepID=UPI00244E5886|nr:general transcription factor II-I repeat domain-containing protein 2-like [Condylostylus longicornis]